MNGHGLMQHEGLLPVLAPPLDVRRARLAALLPISIQAVAAAGGMQQQFVRECTIA
jgi:hypothetical protein